MIKAEYDIKEHGLSCEIHCHCVQELRSELLIIINQCFKSDPEATLDVIEDFMNILRGNMEHDS